MFVLCSIDTSDERCVRCTTPTRYYIQLINFFFKFYMSNSKFMFSNRRSLTHKKLTTYHKLITHQMGENHSDLASKKDPILSRIILPISMRLRIARKDVLMLHFNQLGRGLVHRSRIPSTGEWEGCCRMAWALHQPCNKCLLRITT